ncbi:MAG: oligopeptide transporter, OPT family [Bacteroidetes bacterium]|uniref:Oligopeptide transporter, OPT family n=1 Tax=Candidatus Cryptobacteroides intestinigallinarum TaxID=2840767 RepID=A0A9D9N0Y2_9BACT|nr:oligopeptide transporter, OPT family [Candidatus Cryptobacteroides intestinigallinarum]
MEKQRMTLPENAHRELKDGEQYRPLLSPEKNYPEVTPYSVSLGLLMTIIFSAAAAFLGLKVGQVFEAAIPIAIIAVGVSSALGKKNALGQNVMIQSIGSCSGAIVAGAIFTLPALYILQDKYPELTVNFSKVFFSSLLGGILGILFLIPFRKYFVKEMHGKYPFPEATATTQVLVSGESGGKGARTLLISGLIGGLYDFIISTFGLWGETLTTRILPFGEMIADKAKTVLKINTGAAVLGLGYIVGLKYAFIICCGSFLVWLVIIPLMNLFWHGQIIDLMNTGITMTIGEMSPEQIFSEYARHIGIGGIATAGIIGIVKSFGVIKSAVGLAASEFSRKKTGEEEKVVRTQRDISMKIIAGGIAVTLIAVLAFFAFGVVDNIWHAVIGLLVVGIIAFLFTTVAANAIAIVGSNPVSGMTLMTLILASLIMVASGLSGTAGMTAALIIGGVVCTALSVAGAFVTDLKIGYWIGSTPAKQETWKFLGTLVAAATVGGVMMILNKTYGFTGENALVAPQANAMAAVIEPMMNGGGAPWLLYGIGALLALILTAAKVPALPFALGMFIPIDLNLPMLVGGAISWYVGSRSKDKALNDARQEKGTLIASGFIAGGALMGVVSAILRFAKIDWYIAPSSWTEPVAIIPYAAIIVFMGIASLKAKKA